MNEAAWLALSLTFLSVVLIPLIVLIYRGAVKWTRVEEKLDRVARDLAEVIKDKDETHRAMFDAMKDDRAATNARLRWLEEHIWNRDQLRRKNALHNREAWRKLCRHQ